MELGRLKKQPEIGLVNLYYLSPEYRGKNLSIYLDKYAEEFLKKNGHQVAQLNVSPTNLRAFKFYIKNGWIDIGPNPNYPGVHTMEKTLK